MLTSTTSYNGDELSFNKVDHLTVQHKNPSLETCRINTELIFLREPDIQETIRKDWNWNFCKVLKL